MTRFPGWRTMPAAQRYNARMGAMFERARSQGHHGFTPEAAPDKQREAPSASPDSQSEREVKTVKMKPDDVLYIHSMGKRLRITAIFHSDADAIAYLKRHSDEGVIAAFDPYVFIANIYDHGEVKP